MAVREVPRCHPRVSRFGHCFRRHPWQRRVCLVKFLPIQFTNILRPVDVGVAEAWDPGFGDFMRKAYHYYPKNGDHNSGDPIGIGVCQLSTHNGNRVTASGAYLASTPPNLSIKTNTTVARLVFEGKRVIGVDIGGETGEYMLNA